MTGLRALSVPERIGEHGEAPEAAVPVAVIDRRVLALFHDAEAEVRRLERVVRRFRLLARAAVGVLDELELTSDENMILEQLRAAAAGQGP